MPLLAVWIDVLLWIGLSIGILVGLAAIPLGLSGNFILLGVAALYDLAHGFDVIGLPLLVAFLALAVLGEIVEALLGSVVARRYGASRWGMFAAFAGGVAGAVVGSGVVPVLGAIVGSFVGAFLAALLAEWISRGSGPEGARGGLRAGWGALVGRVGAAFVKVGIGGAIGAVTIARAINA